MVSKLLPLAAALLAAAISLPAQADTEQARKLLAEGRAGQALRVLDEQLAGSPQDAEARFLRGLALSRIGRRDEAIDTFKKLSADYPQLPEPYNNLAVIYAQQGDYEKARKALESALATHPSYATAHENLGDIYAALASAAYSRALSLGEESASAQRKLRVLEQLSSTGSVASAASTAPTATTDSEAADDTETTTAPDTAMAPPAQAPATGSSSERATRERISAAVYDWSQAWQNQDVDAYLAAYAPEFDPAGGLSRDAWETQRRERVGSPDSIRVRVRNPDIQIINDERARVTFEQEYESDTYSDVTNKVLDLRRSGDRWLILRETTR